MNMYTMVFQSDIHCNVVIIFLYNRTINMHHGEMLLYNYEYVTCVRGIQ